MLDGKDMMPNMELTSVRVEMTSPIVSGKRKLPETSSYRRYQHTTRLRDVPILFEAYSIPTAVFLDDKTIS